MKDLWFYEMKNSNFNVSFLCFILFLGTCYKGYGQEKFSSVLDAKINVRSTISEKYSLSFALSSLLNIYKDQEYIFGNQGILLDHYSNWKIKEHKKTSLGLRYFNANIIDSKTKNYFQVTEQYTITKQRKRFYLKHRFRLQQRIFSTSTFFFQRYQFSAKFPFHGQIIKKASYYMLSSLEGIWIFSNTLQPKYDIRLDANLGNKLTKKFDLQLGVSYRLENITVVPHHKIVFLATGNLKI